MWKDDVDTQILESGRLGEHRTYLINGYQNGSDPHQSDVELDEYVAPLLARIVI